MKQMNLSLRTVHSCNCSIWPVKADENTRPPIGLPGGRINDTQFGTYLTMYHTVAIRTMGIELSSGISRRDVYLGQVTNTLGKELVVDQND